MRTRKLSERVANLEFSHGAAMALLGEIMATLHMPHNEPAFCDLPEEWHMAVRRWHGRYREIVDADKQAE